MTVSTAAQLIAEIAADLPSGNPTVLTAASLRTVLGDMVASLQANPTVNAQVGTTYTVLIGDLGKLVTFSNSSPVAVTLPQATGAFAAFNVTFLNLGVGTVTVTPTTSTINGSSNVVIVTNGCVRIVADGANYQVTSGVAVTANGPASSLARILDLTQSVGGTDTVTHQFNNIAITDTADLGANVGNGINIALNYGGGKGSRQAAQIGMTLTSPSNASTKHFYAALATNAQANSGDGGTNTGGGAKGSIIGFNPSVTLNSGATNLAEASGIQVTMFSLAGSSVSQRSGIEISDNSGAGGIQGATFDDAIVLGNVAGSAGWKIGLAFDATNFGAGPLATSGTAIATVGTQTFATGVDFSSAVLTNFLKGPNNFVVDGNGNLQVNQGGQIFWLNRALVTSPADGIVKFSNFNGNGFTKLILGPDSAAPGTSTIATQNVAAGTSNTAGANLVIAGSQGTGTGAGGAIQLQVAPAGGSGTSQNALVTAMTLQASGGLSIGTTTDPATGGLFVNVAAGIGVNALTSSFLALAAGTTAKAQINLGASTAPTSPNNGDFWFDGTNVKIRVGGATKTFTIA